MEVYPFYRKVVKLLNEVFFRSKEESKIEKKIFLILCALHAVRISLKENGVYTDQLITCLKMYYSSCHDPLITIFEVRCFLYVTFFHMDLLYLFNQYAQEFDRLLPECPAKMEPRKLTHIARCQVRQNLKTSKCPLPAALNKLGLPKTVKNFILGDLFDISRKNGTVSSQNAVTKEELMRLFFGQYSTEMAEMM